MDLLDPIDLTERIRLGQNALLGGLDPSQGYMPYWNSRCEEGKLVAFRHGGAWDWCHDVARGIHALGMAEQATGDSVPVEVWKTVILGLMLSVLISSHAKFRCMRRLSSMAMPSALSLTRRRLRRWAKTSAVQNIAMPQPSTRSP